MGGGGFGNVPFSCSTYYVTVWFDSTNTKEIVPPTSGPHHRVTVPVIMWGHLHVDLERRLNPLGGAPQHANCSGSVTFRCDGNRTGTLNRLGANALLRASVESQRNVALPCSRRRGNVPDWEYPGGAAPPLVFQRLQTLKNTKLVKTANSGVSSSRFGCVRQKETPMCKQLRSAGKQAL